MSKDSTKRYTVSLSDNIILALNYIQSDQESLEKALKELEDFVYRSDDFLTNSETSSIILEALRNIRFLKETITSLYEE